MKRFLLLEARGIRAGYGRGPDVLNGVDVEVGEHEIVTILGSNGAGKTTVLRVVSGLLAPRDGRVLYMGEDITGVPAHQLVARGLAMVPSGRMVFSEVSVEDNLLIGGYQFRADRRRVRRAADAMFQRFPALASARRRPAGTLSGGEQQLLSIARGMMGNPRLLILDEPSLGLAPKTVVEIFEVVKGLREGGTTLLLVEKLAHLATSLSDRIVVMQLGNVIVEGDAATLASDPRVEESYLGRLPAP